jgi:hypothetical protein
LVGVELWCALRALPRPDVAVRQLAFKRTILDCPFMRVSRKSRRRVPDDRAAWLEEVEAAHPATSFLGADRDAPAA